jgi:hypothetical protein
VSKKIRLMKNGFYNLFNFLDKLLPNNLHVKEVVSRRSLPGKGPQHCHPEQCLLPVQWGMRTSAVLVLHLYPGGRVGLRHVWTAVWYRASHVMVTYTLITTRDGVIFLWITVLRAGWTLASSGEHRTAQSVINRDSNHQHDTSPGKPVLLSPL